MERRARLKGIWIAAGVCAVLIAIGAGALSHGIPGRSKPVEPKAAAKAAPLPSEISLAGRVAAQHTIRVPAPINGRIEAFHADAGQEVYEGELLAQIRSETLTVSEQENAEAVQKAQDKVNALESDLIAARLEASRARADAGRANTEFSRTQRIFERQRMLLSEGATPRTVKEKAEKEFVAAETEWKSLNAVATKVEERVASIQASYDNAKKILAHLTEEQETTKAQLSAGDVHSPVTGVVVARRGDVGESVDPSLQDLFQIAVDLTLLQVVANADPGSARRIQAGQAAMIYIAELPGEALPGIVKEVQADRVTVEFTSPTTAIKPGLSAQARIRVT